MFKYLKGIFSALRPFKTKPLEGPDKEQRIHVSNKPFRASNNKSGPLTSLGVFPSTQPLPSFWNEAIIGTSGKAKFDFGRDPLRPIGESIIGR